MVAETERRLSSQESVDRVLATLPTQLRTVDKDFHVGRTVACNWKRVSPEGIPYETFAVGRLVEIDGEPRFRVLLAPKDLKSAEQALRKMRKWWMAEYLRLNPPWWRKLARFFAGR